MIRIVNTSTFEYDDPNAAVEEILDQIEFGDLLQHTIGIIGCELNYVENGTIKLLTENLPFDVVGSTTYISDITGDAGEDQLSLFIMTSDEIEFACGMTEPITEHVADRISEMYRTTAKKLSGKPSLALFVGPYLLNASGDAQVRALEKASGGIPLFGTIALDYIEGVRDPRVIYNGEGYPDRMALILISGDIVPHFMFKAISDSLFLKQKAIVTDSEDNILKEVNNISAAEYLMSLGITDDAEIDSIPLPPLSVDIGDGGRPVTRTVFASTPDGHIICGGDVPVNAILGVGTIDADDVRVTADEVAHEILGVENAHGAIIFSCLGRNRALGLDPMHEIQKIQEVLGDKIPYLFMYSAGEICPEVVNDKALNKAHNDSIVACVF